MAQQSHRPVGAPRADDEIVAGIRIVHVRTGHCIAAKPKKVYTTALQCSRAVPGTTMQHRSATALAYAETVRVTFWGFHLPAMKRRAGPASRSIIRYVSTGHHVASA
eukprot:2809866-Rhodomonas_salina.3